MSSASTARRGPRPTKHLDVLWAAARLFSVKGFAGTTTREIAAAAGTTERTLFKHYQTKERLAEAVISEAIMPHIVPASLDALRDAIQSDADSVEVWHRALLIARSRAIAESPELTRLLLVELLRDTAVRQRFAEQWQATFWEPLTGLFTALQASGRIAADLPVAAVARMLLSLNVGFLVGRHVMAPDLDWDDDEEIRTIAAVFARGLAPRAAP